MNKVIIEVYQGIVIDRLGSLPTKRTRWYENYKQAHLAAEKLCNETYKDRGEIDVIIKRNMCNCVV